MTAKLTLVTGATGFVGQALCAQLVRGGQRVRACVRSRAHGFMMPGVEQVVTGDLTPQSDWSQALAACDTVVHLAARVHVTRETVTEPLAEFRRVNVAATECLATQAAAAGVRRLMYVSSIKVNGELTIDRPFRETDKPSPMDPYGASKWEAEQVLRGIAAKAGLEIVIVRPPLIYGPGVKGNFLSLLQLVASGLPLPFASCHNRRSLVGLSNFVDLLMHCVLRPAAAGQTFLVSDGEDLSTPELLRRVAQAFGKRAHLLPVPDGWLRFAARMGGRLDIYERLCGSLQVDDSNTRRVLDWAPPVTVDAELVRTVQWYLSRRGR